MTSALLLMLSDFAAGYDFVESRELGMGRTLNLNDPTGAGLLQAVSPRLNSGDWLVDAGYHRRFELADLDNLFLTAAYRHKVVTFAVGVSQFGKTDLYAEQLLKGSVAYHRRQWSIGLALSAMQIQIGEGYGTLRAATFGGVIGYADSTFQLALVGDNLTKPSLAPGSITPSPLFTLYATVLGHKAYSFHGRVRRQSGEKTQLGLGQTIRLQQRADFFWGVGTEPFEMGGGIEFRFPFGAITYAASVHPDLGLSHTFSLSFGRGRSIMKGGGF